MELEFKPHKILCKSCKKEPSVITLSTTKTFLCAPCFNNFFEKKVKETIEKYRMFDLKDRVGVFLSGGKDSTTLMAVLKKLYPDLHLQGIYLNLGIRYHSEMVEGVVKELCQKLEVPLYVYNLPEREGYFIDDFIFTSFKDKICSACGTIKRNLFSKIAKELGLTVIATGHHLDDTVSTMFTLFIQGDFSSLIKLSPVLPPLYSGQAKKVKPLYKTPEKEILYYAKLNQLPFETSPCPHGELTPIKKYKKVIEELEKVNPQIKYQLLSVFNRRLIPLLKPSEEEVLETCLTCGEITSSSSKICARCKRISLLEKVSEKTLEVTAEEFLKQTKELEDHNWVLLDLREKEDFERHPIKGACWIPSSLISEGEKKFYKFLKPYKKKILFFTCYSEKLSYLFTLRARKMGFKAYNLKDFENLVKLKIKGD
ncbi:MAG: TIGR00269 family protein [Thermodesulfobacteriaceae bacterium]|nr:TIGR00269 family protein [Thermodesulfobacteriaceae bacterium]MDW8135491.1 TIGR00269 family protein [Thermodesulfobacterium sp.]